MNGVASDNSSSKQLDQDASDSTSASLTARLSSYKDLDDYEYYREERLKQNAMRKFSLIMQSIKTKHKDCSVNNSNNSTNNNESDSDVVVDTQTADSEFSNFNQILKRHRKRFKQNA